MAESVNSGDNIMIHSIINFKKKMFVLKKKKIIWERLLTFRPNQLYTCQYFMVLLDQ